MRKSQAKVVADAIKGEIAALEESIKADRKTLEVTRDRQEKAQIRADSLAIDIDADIELLDSLRSALATIEAVADRG